MSIYFDGQLCGQQIQPLEYQAQYTIENMYQYMQQCQIDISQFGLSVDGQTILNPDNTTIGSFLPPNSGFYIIQQPQPIFNVFFEGQQVLSQALPNMMISEMISSLQQSGQNFGQNFAIDYYDGNQQLIGQDVDINQPLYTYTLGNQQVIINIKSIQQDNSAQQAKGSDKKIPSQKANFEASELLQSLILLKNISLLIDPSGQFVVYKFHFPTLVQGYLQQCKGQDPEHVTQFDWLRADWIEKNKLKYCTFDDYGFAVMWENGKISSVKIKQQ